MAAPDLAKHTVDLLGFAINDIKFKLDEFIKKHFFVNGIESIWAGELGQLQDIEDLPIEDFQGEDKGEDELKKEFLERYKLFKTIEKYLYEIQQPSNDPDGQENEQAINELSSSAKENVDRLLRQLNEYYMSMKANGHELSDIPSVQELKVELKKDRMNLISVLEKFLRHMQHSKEFLVYLQQKLTQ